MANYSNIRNKIISDIKPNNNQEITGQIMQDTLLQMVSLLQDGGYLFKGGATTTTNPIVGDSNVFYLASVKGTYANFGGLQVNDNELAALVYNGSWSKISIDNQIAHLKDIWNVEYLPVFFLRVEFSNDTIAKISIDDVITIDFEAIIDDFINKTAFIFAYNSVNGSSEVNEFLSPVSVRKTEAGDSVEFIFDGINRNRYRVVVNYKDLSIQNQARQLIFLPNVSTLQDGLMSKEDKTKLDGIEVGANKYTLPVASDSTLGGIKSGGGFITVDTDGIVKVNRSQTADNSENDENGDNIVYTYAKKADLPGIATSTVAGIIKGGGDIAVGNDGSVTVNNAGVAQMAQQDSSGRVIVNTYVPKTQIATSSAAGLVKSGNDITVASDGTVTVNSATTVDNIPAATSSKIGGIKSGGDVLVSSSGVVTVNNAASAEEAVHATTADNATNVTNVPVATTSKIGGIKAGANISVSSDGSVIITYADVAGSASTADEATNATYAQNATNDNAGNKIVDTYAKKADLPGIATSTVAGIIKGGGDIAVGNDGSVTVNNAGVAQMAQQDSSGRVIVNTYVPKTQIATSSAAGLVKSGNDITVASDGTVTVNSATTVDNIPAATSSKIGGIKSGGDVLVSSSGVVTVNNAASAEEAVHATTADNATNVTNVPVATTSKIGGIKAGANISVSSDGSVIITYADVAGSASTADEATNATYAQNATNDNAGNKIVDTYAKKADLPGIATSSAAGLVKSGGNITVASDGTVTVNKSLTADVAEEASHASNADVATLASTASIADKAKTVDAATSSKIGGIKSAGDISVDSSGSVTVNNSAFAMQANLANSALRDGAGAQINTTYLKAAAVTDVTDYAEITI